MAGKGVRSRVLFDYTKPELHGYMYKQGGVHKAFKKRYFVLYPGYLVYYTDENKYRIDVVKGSLQNRLHAVRIRGGECHHAKESKSAPKGCKFGFIITAPDPINRRQNYLLNAASREERRTWIDAVKKCCQPTSPNSSPKPGRHGLVSSVSTEEESSTRQVVDSTTSEDDSSTVDNTTNNNGSPSLERTSPNSTNYPNAIRRETGVAAALIPIAKDDSEDSDRELTSFDGPYADSDDDIGPDPEMLDGENFNSRKSSNEGPPLPKSSDIKFNSLPNGHAVTESNEMTQDSASSHTTSPEGDSLVAAAKAVTPDNTSQYTVAAATNSTSEDTDDITPLPVGGHEDNPSDSGTTSDDEDEPSNTTEEPTPNIKVINPSMQRKLMPSNSSPSIPVGTEPIPKPAEPVRRSSAPFIQKTGYLHKRGGKRQTWKQRYFVLTPGMFAYYKNEVQRNKPIGEVKLKNSSVHLPKPGEHKDQTYQFTVHTESQWNKRANYVLAATSDFEMNQWVQAFKEAGHRVVMRDSLLHTPEERSKDTTRTDIVNNLDGDLDDGHTKDDSKPNFERVKFEKDDDDDDDIKDIDDADIDDADTDGDTADELEQDTEQQQIQVEEHRLKDRSESSSKKRGKISMWMSPFRERKSSKSRGGSREEKKTMAKNLRGMVSKQKKRYQDSSYDLDLSYITNQIIAMGFPSEGAESMYRNKLSSVVSFLESKHRYHYKLYNLCSERVYAACKFKNRVAYYPFDDHSAPPLMLIEAFCIDVVAWLKLDERNVAVVHCKAGKGRSGCMIAAYLLYSKSCETAEEAMKFFGEMRTHNGKGVTIPSQRRYVQYVEKVLSSPDLSFSSKSLRLLSKVVMHTVPNFDTAGGCNPYIVIICNHEEIYTSKKPDSSVEKKRHENFVVWQCAVTLSGDVRVEFWDHDRFSDDDLMCCFHFNTLLIDNDRVVVTRKEMDRACKNRKSFSDSFAVELIFAKQMKGMFSKSTINIT
ncbi:uncharacterized protein [Dysidea avara]|uniref:uncharacterized protein isoform X2 n=1 Tax=Dysidea avara TaxID=196820 RepID=UPI00332DF599